MKSIALLFVLVSGTAAATGNQPPAQHVPAGQQQQQQQQQAQQQNSTSQAAAQNNGNNQAITFATTTPAETTSNVVYSGTQTVKNVPSVGGPPLTSSNDTCMGSTSGSVNVAGFGASLGSTWTDENCKMLKNSREMWNMGMKAAALARMCMDKENRESLEMTGFECAQTTRDKQRMANMTEAERAKYLAAQNAQRPDLTDPLVRRRMGMAPLPGGNELAQ